MSMKIFDFPLAFFPPRATLIAAEKRMKYDRVTVNILIADNVKPEFLTNVSSTGTLPALIDGNTKLTSSRQIVEYLDQKDGKPLGSPAVDRAAVKEWMDKIDQWDGNLYFSANAPASLQGVLDSVSWYKDRSITTFSAKHPELKDVYAERLAAMKKSGAAVADPEAVQKNKNLLAQLLEEAEAKLSTQPFLAGSEYTTADTVFTPVLFRIHNMGKDKEVLADKPKVKAYYERIKRRHSFKEAYGPATSGLTQLHLVGGGLAKISLAKLTGF